MALSWTAPTDNGGFAITDYLIDVSTDGSTWTRYADATSTTASATVAGLIGGSSYFFRVAARNSLGEGAAVATSSAATTLATAPAVPGVPIVVAGSNQVTLSWTAPAANGSAITDYVIEYSSAGGTNPVTFTRAASTAITATVTGLTNGTSYVFRIAARNAVGTGTASAWSTQATALSSSQVTLSADGSGNSFLISEPAAFVAASYTFKPRRLDTSGNPASLPSPSVIADGDRSWTFTSIVQPVATSIMDTTAVRVNFVAPSFRDVPLQVQTAIEGIATPLNLGAFTGPDFDGTTADGSEWAVQVRWSLKGESLPATITAANGRVFTAPRGVITLPAGIDPIAFAADGIYTVEVTVIDNDGQKESKRFEVNVGKGTPTAAIRQIVDGGVTDPVTAAYEGVAIALRGVTAKTGVPDARFSNLAWQITKQQGSAAAAVYTSGAGSDFSFTPDDAGIYEVSFSAVDENGTAANAMKVVFTVDDVKPRVIISGLPANSIPEGTAISLTADAVFGGAADRIATTGGFSWSVMRLPNESMAATATQGQAFAFVPPDEGTYVVSVTVTDDDGRYETAKATFTVINARPVFTVERLPGLPAGPVPEGALITFSARDAAGAMIVSDVEGDALNYTWKVERREGASLVTVPLGGTPDTGETFTFTPPDNGDYVVTLTVNDGDGGTASLAGEFTAINVAPTATVTHNRGTGSLVTLTQGEDVIFTLVGSDVGVADQATLGRWFALGDGEFVAASQDGDFKPAAFTASGEYSVRWKMTDKDGGETTGTTTVNVSNTAPTVQTFGEKLSTSVFASLSRPTSGFPASAFAAFGTGTLGSPAMTVRATAAPVKITTQAGSVRLTGSFTDPGSGLETYRGTATIRRTDVTSSDPAATPVTIPMIVKTDKTFDAFYAFASSGTYEVTATIYDSHGAASNPQTLTVQVVELTLSKTTIVENAGSNAVVGALALSTAEAGVTFSLVSGAGDADNALFDVVSGNLVARASLDYETASVYSVRVRAVGTTSVTLEKVFTISVTDVNEAPTAVLLANTVTTLLESVDTALRIRLADIRVTDDALGTATLSLAGPDAASFEIVGTSLYLKAGTSLNAGTKPSYAVTVQAADATLPGSTPATSAFALTIVGTANQAPTGVTFVNAVTNLAESASTATRTKLADIVVADDGRGTNAITLGGPDAAAFEVVGTALYLKAGVALNFEAKTSYAVTVSATDASVAGSTPVTAAFTLSVTNANETPTDLTLSPASVAENAPVGSPVGVLVPTDPDAGETFTYALVSGTGSADNAWFELAGSALRTRAVFDYETRNSYSIRVRVTDAGGLSFEKAFTIAITNVNEPPTAVALSLPDSTPTATNVKLADIAVIDDGLGSNVLTLSGADAGSFQVIGSALYLKAGTSLNAQTKPSYVVTVAAADASLPGTAPVSTTYTLTIVPSGIVVDAGATVTDAAVRVGDYRLVKRGAGTLILDKANTHSGGTVIEAGTIVVKDASALGTGEVRVKAGATLVIDQAAGEAVAGSLVIEEGGFVDLGTGRIRIVAGMTATALVDALLSGKGDGFWTTSAGIGSSAVSAVVGMGTLRTIGWLDNGDGSFTAGFAAQGDTTMDGAVDILDASNFITSAKYDSGLYASWVDGDFNHDGVLDILDATDFFNSALFDQGIYLVSASAPAAMSATEPVAAAEQPSAIESAFAALAFETTATPPKRKNPFASFR